jgi:ATPase subunit of ABC transporter with duplicated ATPase domains
MMMMLEASGLGYGVPRGPWLAREVSFRLESGQTLLVTGPNGSGKSTLLRVILGHHRAREGKLRIGVPPGRIGILPQLQNTAFHLPLTLGDVLRIARRGRFDQEAALAIGLLEREQLGLAWNTSSGGERKRTLLTRILLQSPELLLLDEPLNHLDRASHERVRQALNRYLSGGEGKKRAIVLVSHDPWTEAQRADANVVHLEIAGRAGTEEESRQA